MIKSHFQAIVDAEGNGWGLKKRTLVFTYEDPDDATKTIRDVLYGVRFKKAADAIGSDGKTHRLSDYRGKTVVLAWFPKAFTGGCTAECKSLRQSSQDLRELGVAYFTASCDTPETNRKFAESLELDYPILSDPTKAVARAYGVLASSGFASRWTFYIGADGRIAAVDRNVSAASHGEDMVKKLEELRIAQRGQRIPAD